MNKKLTISLSVVYMSLCNILFANYTISGTVQSEDGNPTKKGLITLVKESNGEEVDKTKQESWRLPMKNELRLMMKCSKGLASV